MQIHMFMVIWYVR
ncbi:hypothetical protein BOH78_3713 [Pichia kudriavzevii]|uniref:Uncharacterized protein n=1 Tax=Pichia kudriavzevii TaxID=4909 RepID=A0A1V2LJ24_PICKU|nr:hypothetical protein BOH78_3713 [Pichia kudriavzevii]